MSLEDMMFEAYVGTAFETSVYTEFLLGTPIYYIIRNANYPDREYRVPVGTHSEVIGTFFNTTISFVAGEGDEPGHLSFVYTPNIYIPATTPISTPTPTPIPAYTRPTQVTPGTQTHVGTAQNDFTLNDFFEVIREPGPFLTLCAIVIITLYLIFKSIRNKIRANRQLNAKENRHLELAAKTTCAFSPKQDDYLEEHRQLVQYYNKLRERRLEKERIEKINALRAENDKLRPENTKFTENLMMINVLKGDGPLSEDELQWIIDFEKDKQLQKQELENIRNASYENDNRGFSLKP